MALERLDRHKLVRNLTPRLSLTEGSRRSIKDSLDVLDAPLDAFDLELSLSLTALLFHVGTQSL